jgi:hypothetical protein
MKLGLSARASVAPRVLLVRRRAYARTWAKVTVVLILGGLACSSCSSGSGGFSCTTSSTDGGGSQRICQYLPPGQTGTAQQLQMTQQDCASSGGIPGTGCSSSGLTGCCTLGGAEFCYYDYSAITQQGICLKESGTWSTTP